MNNPHTKLHERVKGISFAESIQIRDPFTKQFEKKEIKPFMVNQASILLDRDLLILNPNDEMVWKQMEGYQVVRQTVSGRPVYTSENEHSLDALMLAILAFTLEMPEITRILQEFEVARKVAYAPRLSAMDNRAADQSYEKDMWDKSDPEEKRKALVRKSSDGQSKGARQASQWTPRLNSGPKRPKSRKF